MRIATWNINSIRSRMPHVLRWLALHTPDVVALQELKQVDFPKEELEAMGYQVIWSGQKTYNGVALLSRIPCHDVEMIFPTWADEQKRLIAATINGIRVVNIYVPNGQSVGSEKYEYKLHWLSHLRDYLAHTLEQYENVLVMGDFNIAPADIDVHNPKAWEGKVLCSALERESLENILSLGFLDSFRLFPQEKEIYSWWDYRTFAFVGNRGLRIDLILASKALAKKVQHSWIDINPRAWEKPSDHAPVLIELS